MAEVTLNRCSAVSKEMPVNSTMDGLAVGRKVGLLGALVGLREGTTVGLRLGAADGTALGT